MSVGRDQTKLNKFSPEEQEEIEDLFTQYPVSLAVQDNVLDTLIQLKNHDVLNDFVSTKTNTPFYKAVIKMAAKNASQFELFSNMLHEFEQLGIDFKIVKDKFKAFKKPEQCNAFYEALSYIKANKLLTEKLNDNVITLMQAFKNFYVHSRELSQMTLDLLKNPMLLTQKQFDNILGSANTTLSRMSHFDGYSDDVLHTLWEMLEKAKVVNCLQNAGLLPNNNQGEKNDEALIRFRNFSGATELIAGLSDGGLFSTDQGQQNFSRLAHVDFIFKELIQNHATSATNDTVITLQNILSESQDILADLATEKLEDTALEKARIEKNQNIFNSFMTTIEKKLTAQATMGAAMIAQASRNHDSQETPSVKPELESMPGNIQTAILGMFAPGGQKKANALLQKAQEQHNEFESKNNDKSNSSHRSKK